MNRLIIGNQLPQETVEGPEAISEDFAHFLGRVAHRMLWNSRPGDVLLMPNPIDDAFAAHVYATLGYTDQTPTVVVPPTGERSQALLYDDRLADPELIARLRELVRRRDIVEVYPFFFDPAVARLAARIGLAGSVRAQGFLEEGGAEFVNSKQHFRAVAAGNAVAMPPGCCSRDIGEVIGFARRMWSEGHSTIIKQDVHSAGAGNEILTPVEDWVGLGADVTTFIASAEDIEPHVARNWEKYTHCGQNGVIIEHFIHDCAPIYVEYLLDATGVRVAGHGQMRMATSDTGSTMTGLIVPAPASHRVAAFADFLRDGERIASVVHAMGYRGHLSIDAIVTPDDRILFNEFNGRYCGSTHLHTMATQVLGPDYLGERTLLARSRWGWDSLPAVLKTVEAQGLSYDPHTRTGVIVTGDDGQCVFIGVDLDEATALESRFAEATGLGREPR